MNVVWSDRAASQLEAIVDYIAVDSQIAATRFAKSVYEMLASLATFPRRGYPLTRNSVYQIVLKPWPYLATYQVKDNRVLVMSIRHGARKRPPRRN